jgi:hypothetical protein
MPDSATKGLPDVSRLLERLPRSGFIERINALSPLPMPRTGRPLGPDEIQLLEHQGNMCDDWALIRVHPNISLRNIIGNQFTGYNYLGNCRTGLRPLPDGGNIRGGIRHSTLENVILGNDCSINRCPLLADLVIGDEALINDSSISSSHHSAQSGHPEGHSFGNGRWIDIGIETGGRSCPIFADLSLELAESILTNPADKAVRAKVEEWLSDYLDQIRRPWSLIGTGAAISGCRMIRDSYIGPGSLLVNAGAIIGSTLDSRTEQPITVRNGAIIENSVLQEGTSIENQAIVRDSLLFEHSHATDHGTVVSCLIGPNSGVAKGEATASFLGPFVGFHHQSLLIASFWPRGRGNIGYGANVGSNHTSRLADQECWPGEGLFFGLSCCVKFPANFRDAPYSVVATGITTLPQRMSFPFSLITDREPGITGVPEGLNCLIPAWNLGENYFALKRNEEKFKARNKATKNHFDLNLFRPEIMALVEDAVARLERVDSVKEHYLEEDIPGLGRNYLSEPSRQRAIKNYRFFLELVQLRDEWAETRNDFPRAQARRLLDLLPKLMAMAEKSRGRDFARGCTIIDDYAQTHDHPDQDPYLSKMRRDITEESAALRSLMDSAD